MPRRRSVVCHSCGTFLRARDSSCESCGSWSPRAKRDFLFKALGLLMAVLGALYLYGVVRGFGAGLIPR